MCGDQLLGTYFTLMDKLVCEKDYEVKDLPDLTWTDLNFSS